MGLLRKVLGRKQLQDQTAPGSEQPAAAGHTDDPSMIRAFDQYGREMRIPREQWRKSVLPDALKRARGNPDQLYAVLVDAVRQGFAGDVVPYAEQLRRTDPSPSRGAVVLAIVYKELDRLADAERVLTDFIAAHGEDGVVLTNLAQVQSKRGDNARAEAVLWHALELDPNQDAGFVLYLAIQRDRGGETSERVALRRIAALPGSWRARSLLARAELERNGLDAAVALYQEALAQAGTPAPTDLLVQMSSDLGSHGHLAMVTRLVEPHFRAATHGLPVGNNLIRAHYELGNLEAAQSILRQLYAQQRPDWSQALAHWDTELARADVAREPEATPGKLPVVLIAIEGPLWARGSSPFTSLVPAKRPDARRIAVFGSTALLEHAPNKPTSQLPDAAGRLSRAVPLFLAEQIHLTTEASGSAIIPWAQQRGFVLLGHPYEARGLAALVGKGERVPDLVVSVALDATRSPWRLLLSLVQIADQQVVAGAEVTVPRDDPGPFVEQLGRSLRKLLVEHAGVSETTAPDWYRVPDGADASDYLLRLEQQLAVSCSHSKSLEGGRLFGEHEMLDGALQLCLRQPANEASRMVLAETLRHMRKARPETLSEYKDKVSLLQRDHPLAGAVGEAVGRAIAEAMSGEP